MNVNLGEIIFISQVRLAKAIEAILKKDKLYIKEICRSEKFIEFEVTSKVNDVLKISIVINTLNKNKTYKIKCHCKYNNTPFMYFFSIEEAKELGAYVSDIPYIMPFFVFAKILPLNVGLKELREAFKKIYEPYKQVTDAVVKKLEDANAIY